MYYTTSRNGFICYFSHIRVSNYSTRVPRAQHQMILFSLLLAYRRKSDLVYLESGFTLSVSDILSRTVDISNVNICGSLQRYLTDSFANQCLTRSIRIEIHIAICIHRLEKNRSRQYNGNSGKNRAYHRRSQRDRLLHRSGIASKWSKGD